MKRTTIFLPEALERDLYVYARRKGKPAASVVREAVAAYIVEDRDRQVLPSFTAAFDSGHTDTAERHDELLFRTLTPHGNDVASARVRAPRTRSAGPQTTDQRRARRPRRKR